VLQPLVKPKGIDDVPIARLTLWTRDPARGATSSRGRARDRGRAQARPGTRDVYTIGGPTNVVHVSSTRSGSPARLTVADLAARCGRQRRAPGRQRGRPATADTPVQAGSSSPTATTSPSSSSASRRPPVYLEDVATSPTGRTSPSATSGSARRAAPRGIGAAGIDARRR
jgi:hypothetical protein